MIDSKYVKVNKNKIHHVGNPVSNTYVSCGIKGKRIVVTENDNLVTCLTCKRFL